MKIAIDGELRRIVDQCEVPIEVHDERTGAVYYLISADQYKSLLQQINLEHVDPSLYEFTEIRNAE